MESESPATMIGLFFGSLRKRKASLSATTTFATCRTKSRNGKNWSKSGFSCTRSPATGVCLNRKTVVELDCILIVMVTEFKSKLLAFVTVAKLGKLKKPTKHDKQASVSS